MSVSGSCHLGLGSSNDGWPLLVASSDCQSSLESCSAQPVLCSSILGLGLPATPGKRLIMLGAAPIKCSCSFFSQDSCDGLSQFTKRVQALQNKSSCRVGEVGGIIILAY